MRSFIRLLIATCAALIGAVGVSSTTSAHHLGDHLWLGELQDCQSIPICRDHLEPPTELWINLYDGWLNGYGPQYRCYNMGGRYYAYHSQYGMVCYDVDY